MSVLCTLNTRTPACALLLCFMPVCISAGETSRAEEIKGAMDVCGASENHYLASIQNIWDSVLGEPFGFQFPFSFSLFDLDGSIIILRRGSSEASAQDASTIQNPGWVSLLGKVSDVWDTKSLERFLGALTSLVEKQQPHSATSCMIHSLLLGTCKLVDALVGSSRGAWFRVRVAQNGCSLSSV